MGSVVTDMPNNLNAALARLQMELPRIEKDQTAKVDTKSGGSYRYTYADLARVSQRVLPNLGKLGLAFTSRPTTKDNRLVLVYELRHISGEMIEGEWPLPDRGSPQEIGSAITYFRRYCLCAVTGVAPEGDDNDAALAEQASAHRNRSSRSPRSDQPSSGNGGQEPPITGEQKARMQRAFGELGIAGQGDRLQYAIGVVGRQIKSSTELTQFEAGRVIKQAERDVEKRQRADRNGTDRPDAAKPADAVGVPS